MFVVKRSEHNPHLGPLAEHHYEAQGAYNWCPVMDGDLTRVLYRAQAKPGVLGAPGFSASIIAYTESSDGDHFTLRKPFITPEYAWEKFGCEDPRVTRIGDTYYIFYTALSKFPFEADGIRVAVATTKDFKTIDWRSEVTPFNAKAMSLFPSKVNGKFAAILTANSDNPPSKVAIRYFDNLGELTDTDAWLEWYREVDRWTIESPLRNDHEHIEVGAPPVLTEHGWLLVYSHIQNYYTDNKLFGIEALLLDRDNPRKIIGGTKGPLLVPERSYEKYGYLPDIVFPSGALVRDDMLEIYYGATDMTSCIARVHLGDLLDSIRPETRDSFVTRFADNPILEPKPENKFEEKLVFNPAALDIDGRVHMLYRAMDNENTSYFGYASSADGLIFDERLAEPAYWPRADFEMKKSHPTGNSGCEDPRLVEIDNTVYVTYTAYNGVEPPRVAVSSIPTEKFVAHDWDAWSEPVLITPPGVDDKDTCLFPEKIGDKYMILHRVSHRLCGDFIDSLDFENQKITRCIEMIGPRPGMWDGVKLGIAGPPIKTEAGWVLFYHGVSAKSVYRVGVVLFDLDAPDQVKARMTDPIMEPVEPWELEGEIGKVVFPCGQVVRGDTVYLYYGGADTVVGVATLSLSALLTKLTRHYV